MDRTLKVISIRDTWPAGSAHRRQPLPVWACYCVWPACIAFSLLVDFAFLKFGHLAYLAIVHAVTH